MGSPVKNHTSLLNTKIGQTLALWCCNVVKASAGGKLCRSPRRFQHRWRFRTSDHRSDSRLTPISCAGATAEPISFADVSDPRCSSSSTERLRTSTGWPSSSPCSRTFRPFRKPHGVAIFHCRNLGKGDLLSGANVELLWERSRVAECRYAQCSQM